MLFSEVHATLALSYTTASFYINCEISILISTIPCYCGSGKLYGECCEPLHSGKHRASTAEALMRSRYSAFVLKLEAYILATWDKSKRPKKADLTNNTIDWQGLEIIECIKGLASDNKGIVEFKARYKMGDNEFTLHEASRFIRQQGQWLYLDGAVKSLAKPAKQKSLGLNAPCQCGSGKKFKRCCGVSNL